jgi:hypothetical protein
LYVDRKTKQEFVLSSGRQLVQRMVWRVLHRDDVTSIDAGEGMTSRMDPKSLEAMLVTPLDHVLGGERGRNSPYISTTKAEDGQITNYDGIPFQQAHGHVKIDLLLISPSEIIDVSNTKIQQKWGFSEDPDGHRAITDANRTHEVLVTGKIPAAAIVGNIRKQ